MRGKGGDYVGRTKRYIVGLMVMLTFICVVNGSEVQAAKSEANYYKSVLENQLYIEDADDNMESATEFLLYDVDKDGRKELIINGYVGGKSEQVSIIYCHKKNKYVKTVMLGHVEKVSSKGIYTSDIATSGAGYNFYESRYVYRLNSDGKAYEILNKSVTSEYSPSIDDYKTTSIKYYKCKGEKETKITKKRFNALLEKYKLKHANMHQITTENIKKYVK